MSHYTTKPTKWLCAHWRLRSAWASAQSDQSLRCLHEESLGPYNYPLSAQRRLWSDWADAQADLSLRWAHSHFVGFVMSWLICMFLASETESEIDKSNKEMRDKMKQEYFFAIQEEGEIHYIASKLFMGGSRTECSNLLLREVRFDHFNHIFPEFPPRLKMK